MYAVIQDGGKQYKVSAGDTLLLERRDLDEGQSTLTLDQVLMVGEGQSARIGTPYVPGASVSARIVEELKAPKVTGAKFRRRKGYLRLYGHRQRLLKVQIDAIQA